MKILLGILSTIVSLSAIAIYMFGFSGPISVESLFWAAPLLFPIAFLVYLKSKLGGASTAAVLYALAVIGAFYLIRADCVRGNCDTQSWLPIVLAASIAGLHMICMLAVLLVMGSDLYRARRSRNPV